MIEQIHLVVMKRPENLLYYANLTGLDYFLWICFFESSLSLASQMKIIRKSPPEYILTLTSSSHLLLHIFSPDYYFLLSEIL